MGPKSHVAKEISGRGRRGSREMGNQGVGDSRCINILQLFSMFFSITLSYFPYYFYPRHLPTPTTSTHYPGHLVTLSYTLVISRCAETATKRCTWPACPCRRSFVRSLSPCNDGKKIYQNVCCTFSVYYEHWQFYQVPLLLCQNSVVRNSPWHKTKYSETWRYKMYIEEVFQRSVTKRLFC